jgi:hypothetical protein
MQLADINDTLAWLEEARIKSFTDGEHLVIEFANATGGPGEDVALFVEFSDVCHLNLPTLFNWEDELTLHRASCNKANQFLPALDAVSEDEYGEEGLELYFFSDADTELPYFVLSYGLSAWQEPESWTPPRPED